MCAKVLKGKDLHVVETCSACPEQYDVYYGVLRVGYLRLRNGLFTAETGGRMVYSSETDGDGAFTSDERPFHMKAALRAIARQLTL